MKYLVPIVFALVLFTTPEIIPQKINYFPISIGNEYQYFDYYNNYPLGIGYCRIDSLGNVYSGSKPFFWEGKPDEYLFFKADAKMDEIWKVAWDFNPVIDTGYAQCIFSDSIYIFGKNRMTKGVKIFDISYNYFYFYFTEDLGIVLGHVDEDISGSKLNYAKIDNIIYGVLSGINDKNELLKYYSLSQNYPNPFNPTTTISYSLPTSSNVKLIVFNTLGQEIKTLVSEYKSAGNYSINFNASALPSGIYFYKLESAQFTQIKKMILLK